MSWFKRSRDHSDNHNVWVEGFKAGFRTGFDQAFTLAYDQIKKSFNFSTEEIRSRVTDEIYKRFDDYIAKKES